MIPFAPRRNIPDEALEPLYAHDPMCVGVLALDEGATARHAESLCNCEYVRSIRADQVRRDERSIRDRAARMEVDWNDGWTDNRIAYVQGMHVAADTVRGLT